ncbi:hypothetical protein LY76DRAFT_328741 [Colletotrichum caudatum]|nr:hypothetical protein LY76DRAFT_328741 [Colletotrichum caudatum]
MCLRWSEYGAFLNALSSPVALSVLFPSPANKLPGLRQCIRGSACTRYTASRSHVDPSTTPFLLPTSGSWKRRPPAHKDQDRCAAGPPSYQAGPSRSRPNPCLGCVRRPVRKSSYQELTRGM